MTDLNAFLKGKRKPTVCYPDPLPEIGPEDAPLDLWGYHIPETNYYNVVSVGAAPSPAMGGLPAARLGSLTARAPEELPADGLAAWTDAEGHARFAAQGTEVCNHPGDDPRLIPVRLRMDIFSRNTGILESDVMMRKGAIIIGCGSVGSLVALELARAGVGRFLLVDGDIFGYHNICRHQCGVQDVGKFKTTALRERLLQINPAIEVVTAHDMIQRVPLALLDPFCNPDGVIVGCADNREGDLYAAQELARPSGMPFVSIGCWERAFAGEIFYCLPQGQPGYPDLMAAMGQASGRVNANTHLYMGEVGSFEPGISVDINFVTTIAVKMILDLLNRDNAAYTQRLLPGLTQYTLVCNTNNPKIGGDMADIFAYPLQVTTSINVDYAPQAEPETTQR